MTFSHFLILCFLSSVNGYCDRKVPVGQFDIETIFGMWFAVGYAQHTPDLTNKPTELDCIVLHIRDVTKKEQEDWFDWPPLESNWSKSFGRWPNTLYQDRGVPSYRWSDTTLNFNHEVNNQNILKLIWVEDGFSIEQNYIYYDETPTLWTSELWREDEWNLGDNIKRFEVIKILKASSSYLILHHCIDGGDGRVFSLILRRTPSKMSEWDWKKIKRMFYTYELPYVYREASVCSANNFVISCVAMILSLVIIVL